MFSFMKVPPTTYILHYKGGKLKREGAGLFFFYYVPTSTIVTVPLASADAPFVFAESTADFQSATIQGQLTYRITDPKRLAGLLDFSVTALGKYISDDPRKLPSEKFNPGAWLSTPSINCNERTGDVLLKPRVLMIVNPSEAEVRSTPFNVPSAS